MYGGLDVEARIQRLGNVGWDRMSLIYGINRLLTTTSTSGGGTDNRFPSLFLFSSNPGLIGQQSANMDRNGTHF